MQMMQENNLINSDNTVEGHSNYDQSFAEGGLVNTYNDQKSAQNFVQKYNEGGLVQNFQGGGLVDNTAIPMIKQHEGLRLKKYIDSRGFPTIGYGHLVDRNENIPDTITESQADLLFEKDYDHHKKAAMKIPGYTNATVQQKAALIDLTFNMGPGWVDGFPKFKKAFASGNYDVAADELINSNWYSQVNTRGPVIVDLIRDTGGSVQGFNKGGEVPGSGNKDTVPAMLTPGEFVMSKGAVSKWGAGTLASMNAAGGGTNRPSVMSHYSGGGSVLKSTTNNFNLKGYRGGGYTNKPMLVKGYAGGGSVSGGDTINIKLSTSQRGPAPISPPTSGRIRVMQAEAAASEARARTTKQPGQQIPEFSASTMISPYKIKTLGITV